MTKKKPVVNTTSTYNINQLPSDRRFEELIHRIFEFRVKDDLKAESDRAHLMTGGSERGVDIQLKLKGRNIGAIQCKMNTSGNLNKPTAAKEIIKFVLYYLQDKSMISNIRKFKYYFVASGKYSGTAIKLLSNFKKEILTEPDFDKWTKAILKGYSAFKSIKYNVIEKDIKRILSQLSVIPLSYNEVNGWLNKYSEVVDEFFEIKKVVDSKTIKEGLDKIEKIIDPDKEKMASKLITDYYKSAKSHLDIVKFIGHDIQQMNRPRNISLSNLYVEPHFSQRKKKQEGGQLEIKELDKCDEDIPISKVFGNCENYIVLGDPGAGKSLLVKNLVLRIIKKVNLVGGLKNYNDFIPFRIELRKYSELKSKSDTSIISYLVLILTNEYQVNGVKKDIIEHVIRNYPTLIFFDGLDEIFDIGQKNIVKDDILNFLNVNSLARCVITSRFRGYHDVSFPDAYFNEFGINNFDKKQVDKFIDKFYDTQISNKKDREREVESCKVQLQSVDENLKSNPLILSLIALLVINKIVIPDSKLDVYRSITNTLVETRDRDEKNLNFQLKVKNKRATFGHLAYWQYCQTTKQSKINRNLAKNAISTHLIKIKSDPIKETYEAEEAANQFLNYAESRSIYFDDNFTHKTFLEFYVADYLYTKLHNGEKHKERDRIIRKYIDNSAWHIVFELFFSMIDEGLVESNVIDKLIKVHHDQQSLENLYFFLGQLKKTKNIGKLAKERIIESSIIYLLNNRSRGNTPVISKMVFLLKRISRDKDIFNTFQGLVLKLESRQKSLKSKIKFYIFYQEICLDYFTSSDLEFNVGNVDELYELHFKDSHLFKLYEFRILRRSGAGYFLVLRKQIELFGLQSVVLVLHPKFGVPFVMGGTLYNYIQVEKFDSGKRLLNEFKSLSELGLNAKYLRNIFFKRPFRMHFRSERLVSLIKILVKSRFDEFDEFWICIISKVQKEGLIKVKKYLNHPKFKDLKNII